MPERIYKGPHAEVYVPLPDGTTIEVKSGMSAEFPNDVAKTLDEQGDTWGRKGGAKPKPDETADGGKE
jgi:hypothetical protein